MSDLRLRARTVTELVDASFSLYRHAFVPLVTLSALFGVPLLLLELLVPTVRIVGAETMTFPALAMTAARTITFWVTSAVIMVLGSRIYLGEEAEIRAVVRETMPRMPAYLVASLLQSLLFVLGVLFLIVGSFYAMARWFAASVVVVLEDKGAIESLGRSTRLSAGRKRHILGTMALGFVIYFVLSIGLVVPGAWLDSIVLELILGSALAILMQPFLALLWMMLYYDTRIRNEAFDLERMAGELDSPLSPAS